MINKIKEMVARIIFWLYFLLFRTEPGPNTHKFIKNLGFIFSGMFVAKVFALIFQVYIGRTLGAFEYGKYGFANSVAAFLEVPILLGVGTAMVKYLSEDRTDKDKQKIVSSAFMITIITIVIFACIYVLLYNQLAFVLSTNYKYILSGILIAVTYSAWTMSQKLYQGLNKMKKMSFTNIALNAIILSLVFALFTLFGASAYVAIITISIAYVIAATLMMPELFKFFRPKLDLQWSKALLLYGLVAFLGIMSFVVTENINKILINMFLTLSHVGLYQAYHFASITLAAFLSSGFIMVFFPAVSGYKDKSVIFGRVNRMLKLSPLLFLVLLAASVVILMLYGSEYPIIPELLVLFATLGVINFVYSTYSWFGASIGIKGVKVGTYSFIMVSIISVILSWYLIPRMELHGAAISIIISYIIGTVYLYFKVSNLVRVKT